MYKNKNKINTLVIAAYSEPFPKRILIDTLLRGVLRIPYNTTLSKHLNILDYKGLFTRALQAHYEKLSYMQDWLHAVASNQKLSTHICNINNLIDLAIKLKNIKDYDLVIIMHSVLGDDCRLINNITNFLDKRNCPVVAFIGNEYDLISEKKQILNSINAEYICTQLPLKTAVWLYEDIISAKVIELPHALNPKKYFDFGITRDNIIGFIGNAHPIWIGDNDRSNVILRVKEVLNELNFKNDIYLDGKNLVSNDWALFLNKSLGTIGAESGTYFLDKYGEKIAIAKQMFNKNKLINLNDLFEKIYSDNSIEVKSAKCISPRHFEAIGTKTCQLLLDGEYNNLLIPDIHFIKINKNLDNLKDAIMRLLDYEERTNIVNCSYRYVYLNHTYENRINKLLNIINI